MVNCGAGASGPEPAKACSPSFHGHQPPLFGAADLPGALACLGGHTILPSDLDSCAISHEPELAAPVLRQLPRIQRMVAPRLDVCAYRGHVRLYARKVIRGDDQNYRASTYVELLPNDHALPRNIKVTLGMVSFLQDV